MLTPDEKDLLRMEEIYREEVRSELAGPSSLSAALNKPFTIWFLSTVVVGLATLLFSELTTRQQQAASVQNRINELDIEISTRARTMGAFFGGQEFSDDEYYFDDDMRVLISSMFSELGFIQQLGQENQRNAEGKRTLISLYWELHDLVPPEDRPPILEAIAITEEIANRLTKAFLESMDWEDSDLDLQALSIYNELLQANDRWKKFGLNSELVMERKEQINEKFLIRMRSINEAAFQRAVEEEEKERLEAIETEKAKVNKIEGARRALGFFPYVSHEWDTSGEGKCQGVKLSIEVLNNTGKEIEHLEAKMIARSDTSHFVASNTLVNWGTIEDAETFLASVYLTCASWTNGVFYDTDTPATLAEWDVVFFPTLVVYQDGSRDEFYTIHNDNLFALLAGRL